MLASITNLALPLLLLSPFAAAAPSGHGRRSHKEHAVRAQQQEARDVVNGTHTLDKRQSFNGVGTFYYVNVGPGACGQWNNNNDYTVALNSAQYGGGYPGPQCFKTITIQANGVTVGGVRIMDECPTCGYGSLDLSPGLFQRFADESAGVININWWFDGSNPQPQPQPTTQPPTSTSEWHEPSPTPQWTPPPSSAAPSPSPTTPPPPPPPSSAAPSPSPSSVRPSPSVSAPASSSVSPSPSIASSSASASASASSSGVNAFAILSSVAGSSTAVSGSASVSATATSSAAGAQTTHVLEVNNNNLEALNSLIANYGQIVVAGAGGH